MRRACRISGMAAALALVSGEATAQQALGAEVYPGARPLAGKTAQVRAATGADASCYRTADGADAVNAFYVDKGGFTIVQGVLHRGDTEVVLHTSAGGGASRYTVFCIVATR